MNIFYIKRKIGCRIARNGGGEKGALLVNLPPGALRKGWKEKQYCTAYIDGNNDLAYTNRRVPVVNRNMILGKYKVRKIASNEIGITIPKEWVDWILLKEKDNLRIYIDSKKTLFVRKVTHGV